MKKFIRREKKSIIFRGGPYYFMVPKCPAQHNFCLTIIECFEDFHAPKIKTIYHRKLFTF
jgi:hypothetical protein